MFAVPVIRTLRISRLEFGLSSVSAAPFVSAPRTQVRSQALLPIACSVVACAAGFGNMVDINFVDNLGDRVGLDWQVAIKLGIAACAAMIGVWGWINSLIVRRSLVGVPGIVTTALAGVFLLTSVFAIDQVANVSRAASLIYLAYLLFVPTALLVIGLRGLVTALLIGMTVNMVVNWGLYWIVPSIGIFQEELTETVQVGRMGGLGHPNAVGRIAALAGLLGLSMLRSRELAPTLPFRRTMLMLVIVLSAVTVVAAFSRTALLAGAVAALFLVADRLSSRGGLAIALSMMLVVGFGLFAVELVTGGQVIGKFLLSAGTKTGQVEELTSATGRTEIWAETVRLISERPVTGYGLNSAPYLLAQHSHHPHNLMLHVLLSGGILAGILVAALLLWSLAYGLTSSEPLIRGVSMYVLVSGVFEDTCLDTFATPATLLWLVVLLYPAIVVGLKHRDGFAEQCGNACG